MPIATLVPTAVSDPNANIASGAVTDIDNTIASANDAAFIRSVSNGWSGGVGAGSAYTLTMSDLPGNATSINTVQFRVRGQTASIAGAPDDTWSIRCDVTGTGAPTTQANWSTADEGQVWANRGDATAQSSSATVAQVNAWQVRIYQQTWNQSMGPDGMYMDISEVEIIVDYNASNPVLVDVPTRAMTLTGLAPTIINPQSAIVPVGSLVLAGQVPTILTPKTVDVPVGSLSLSGAAPTVLNPGGAQVPVGSLTLTGLAPTIINPQSAIVPPGSLTLTGLAPTANVGAPVIVDVPVGSMALAGIAPSVGYGFVVPAGSLALAGQAPSVFEGTTTPVSWVVEPPVGAIAFTGLVPTVDVAAGLTINVPTASLSLAGQAPTVVNPQSVTVPAGSLSLSGLTPTILTPVLTDVPVGTLSLAGLAPTVINPQGMVVPAGSLTLSGLAPTIINPQSALVPVGSMTLTGLVPTVDVSQDRTVEVPTGALTLAGQAPTILNPISISIPVASLTLTGLQPIVDAGGNVTVNVPAGSLAFAGFAPVVVNPQGVIVPVAALALTGFAPLIAEQAFDISAITPSSFYDDLPGVVVAGAGFGSLQGALFVGNRQQVVTAWADGSITFTAERQQDPVGLVPVRVRRWASAVPYNVTGLTKAEFSPAFARPPSTTGGTENVTTIAEFQAAVALSNRIIQVAAGTYVGNLTITGSNLLILMSNSATLRGNVTIASGNTRLHFRGGNYGDLTTPCLFTLSGTNGALSDILFDDVVLEGVWQATGNGVISRVTVINTTVDGDSQGDFALDGTFFASSNLPSARFNDWFLGNVKMDNRSAGNYVNRFQRMDRIMIVDSAMNMLSTGHPGTVAGLRFGELTRRGHVENTLVGNRIYAALNSGGGIQQFEKVRFQNVERYTRGSATLWATRFAGNPPNDGVVNGCTVHSDVGGAGTSFALGDDLVTEDGNNLIVSYSVLPDVSSYGASH